MKNFLRPRSLFVRKARNRKLPQKPASQIETFETRVLLSATASVGNVTTAGGTSHAISVQFVGEQRLDPFVFDNDDILVTGPNGFSEFATLDALTPRAYTEQIIGDYTLVPPGGAWGAGDEGTYVVNLRGNEIRDIYGESFPAATLGSFVVDFGGSVSSPGSFVFSSANATVAEDAGNAQITVQRVNGSDGAVTVNYATSSGTATAGADFTTTSGTLTFPDGVTSQTIEIPIADDASEESEESFLVTLSGPTGGANLGLVNEVTVALTDNDQPPPGSYPNAAASVPDVNQPGGVIYEFQVTYRSDSAMDPWTIDNRDIIVTGPGGFSQAATAVVTERNYTSTINATYRITPPGGAWDAADEGTYSIQLNRQVRDIYGEFIPASVLDTFEVSFGGGGGGSTPGTLGLVPSTASVDEFAGTVTFSVTRTGGTDGLVTVDYGTASSGSASANSDYTAVSDTLTFADGQSTALITVPIIDDNDVEANETFTLVLANATGGASLGQSTATITIVDNDVAATPGTINITITELDVHEDSDDIVVTLLRTGGSDGAVTVDYATANGTAIAGQDYSAISGTLTFGDGETDRQLTIPLINDTDAEDNETFTLTLSNPAGGATIGQAVQTITIEDNDGHTHGPVFTEDFENNSAGWVVDAANTDSATTGQWQIGSPQQTLYNGTLLQRGDTTSGTGALVTGLSAGSRAGSFDVDSGVTSILSPQFQLPANSSIELAFNYTFGHLNNADSSDFLRVYVVGDSTVTAFNMTGNGSNRNGVWTPHTIGISQFSGQDVRLRIEAADAASGSLVEAAIDDIVVTATPNGPGAFTFEPDVSNVLEDVGLVTLTIRRSGNAGAVTVDFATANDTATAGLDYTATSGTVSFANGQTTQTVSIPILNDSDDEPLEGFHVELSNPTGGATLSDHIHSHVNIVDNDSSATDYLPDLTPIVSTSNTRYVDTTEQPGRALLRISTEVANAGNGPLEMWGGATAGNVQQVFQRIYQDGGYRDNLAGEFVYHPSHGHIHFEGFAEYNLREINPNGTVGTIVATGGKTSFCLLNVSQALPDVTNNAARVHGRGGNSCGSTQGISTGYSDVYGANLDDQWIDITNIPDGNYWLEVITDPDNKIQETDETNNIGRMQITVDNPYSAGGSAQPVNADLGTPVTPLSGANGAGIVVAVIDSGVDLQHPDLAANIWENTDEIDGDNIDNDGNGYVDDVRGFDFVNHDSGAFDENGHGTFIAGVIGALNNGIGTTGLAAGAKIMPLRVLNEDNRGLESEISEAIRYAVNNGADVINLSLFADESVDIDAALQFAADNNVFVAVASGNDASDTPSYPATLSSRFPNVLSVGAWNGTDYLLAESNRVGNSGAVQLDAPGVQESTTVSAEYGSFLGTSVAAANVSATAAMILQEHPGLTGSQIREMMLSTASPEVPGSDSLGTLNIVGAVGRAQLNDLIEFSLEDTTQNVTLTRFADQVVVNLQTRTLKLNGVTYPIAASADALAINGQDGADSIVVTGTTGDDRIVIRPETLQFPTSGLSLNTVDTENVTVHGGGGSDIAFLFDSATGNDTFAGKPEFGALIGDGFASVARDVDQVAAYSTGGTDHAQFFDSAGDEQFVAKPEYATMTGANFYHVTNGFASNRAYATGGHDVAQFYDSAADDLYVAKPTYALLSGTGFYSFGRGFDATAGYSVKGGNDSAQFYDSAADDIFVGRKNTSYMLDSTRSYANTAKWFTTVNVYANGGGQDEVQLYDSAGDETVRALQNRTVQFSGADYSINTSRFERVRAFSTRGGSDLRDQHQGLDYFFQGVGNWLDD